MDGCVLLAPLQEEVLGGIIGGKADGAWKPRPRQVSDRQAGGAVNPPPVFSWHWWLVILSSPATVPVREQGSMDSPSISLEHGALSAMP